MVFAIFAKKNSSFRLPYQRPSSSADCSRELFNGSNRSARSKQIEKKFFAWGCGFFVSDIISEVVLDDPKTTSLMTSVTKKQHHFPLVAGAHGLITLTKNLKPTPLMSPTQNPKLISLQTRRHAKSFESFRAQSTVELWSCKVARKYEVYS